ncbi:apolipoprotein A-II [Platichthys flesus]|uniref:Putative 14 kDa apolipoprotein n=1 Tax=Platichthys flesus TaxID=8260 RepID=Q5DVH3_PLAFE|nr:apolipoprotein A-II [Platichthys flesus]XP_062255722.1 apolipoprotein A-II [Platichthys flesus]CAH57705.1 putative 14 kDa apolipoprotein [Platichthys flesus]
MNAKYVLALILALQVSTCLCEVPAPSQELIDKYDAMRTMFIRRLMHAYGKIQEAAAPLAAKISESERGQSAKTYVDDIQAKPAYQAVVKVGHGLVEEAGPLVDKARTSALGVYEEYMRPQVGQYLSDVIDHIKAYLDLVMPAE